jgi:hypothetical protein
VDSRRKLAPLLACLVYALAGSPAPAADPDCPDSFEDVIASPRRLFERASSAVSRGDLENAYRYASLVRRFHPDSEQADEAFLLATRAFRPLWRTQRIEQPNSLWSTAEPAFLFQWATDFFEGDTFPQQQVDSLLRKMPKTYSQLWTSYVKRVYGTHGVKQWDFEFRYDNGLVDEVRGVLARPAPAAEKAGSSS